MKVTRVERPAQIKGKDKLYVALRATLRNGQAVTVDVTGRSLHNVQARARGWAKRKGYMLHYQTVESGVVMWLEGPLKEGDTDDIDKQEEGPGEEAGTKAS
jgi:predicted SPOUT superfamily RNA methylase MTH1